MCVTVKDEEKTIGRMLQSLMKQMRKPDEIVVIDGGSTDRTVEILRECRRRVRIVEAPGTSIAQGRNLAIKKAKYNVIAQIDAGCVARRDWLEKLVKPFIDKRVDIVAGFYDMVGESAFQKAAAPFLGVPPNCFDKDKFMPSARSMAFRKKVWEEVGGYSEKLERAGEDSFFVYQVLKKGFQITRVKSARVEWEIPKNFFEVIKKFYVYAKGDAQAGIWWDPQKRLSSHNIKILSVYTRYLIGFGFLFCFFRDPVLPAILIVLVSFYLLWSVWKMRDVVKDWKARLWLPIIQIFSDWAVMVGFLMGSIGNRRLD